MSGDSPHGRDGRPHLIAFGGLPGTGKTTLARQLVERTDGVLVSVDTIERALVRSDVGGGPVGDAGYRAAYAIAADNLSYGRVVVADCVNPLALTRNAWAAVARSADARMTAVEVVCSDVALHRRRVEDRLATGGAGVPSWADVIARDYEPWEGPRIVIDTAVLDPDAALDRLVAELSPFAE